MLKDIKIVYRGGEDEITEKKSRFIAQVMPVNSEDEALAFLESVRKKHWNARHHCFAYVIGERNELTRCSDDGEPQGTAGKPILEVLTGADVHNAIIIVTRYFGGTLLGTGGLVRAYSQAAKAGLSASVVISKTHGLKLEIATDYTRLGKIQYLLTQRGITPFHIEYTEAVSIQIFASDSECPLLKKEITESTGGQAQIKDLAECFFAEINGQMHEIS